MSAIPAIWTGKSAWYRQCRYNHQVSSICPQTKPFIRPGRYRGLQFEVVQLAMPTSPRCWYCPSASTVPQWRNPSAVSGGGPHWGPPPCPSSIVSRSAPSRLLCEVRMGSLNVGTMEGKAWEVVEMMKRRKMEVLCVHERKWKRQGTEDGGGIQYAARRRRRKG